MNKFLRMLDQYDKIVLDVSVFTDDDALSIQNMKFSVYDYYKEESFLKLVQFSGSELVLPMKDCYYLNEEDDTDSWVFKHGNVEIYILPIYCE